MGWLDAVKFAGTLLAAAWSFSALAQDATGHWEVERADEGLAITSPSGNWRFDPWLRT